MTTSNVYAQIIPDTTLPFDSTVIQTDNVNLINGGTQIGGNLFHSFERFDIPTGAAAIFNNSATVQNILTRVTGTNVSQIDGLITAAGKANLFFINPNGIIFGANARLNIGGSFLGSTASSIQFGDGSIYAANTNQVTPLLTISAPTGLNFGDTPGAITVQGQGHSLTIERPQATPYNRNSSDVTGLQVQPGETIGLVGGKIDVVGGVITAPSGRIELGSVGQQGNVNINQTDSGFTLSYPPISNLNDLHLSSLALLDVSGVDAGAIQLYGRQVSLNDGSVAWVKNQGIQKAGDIQVFAIDGLTLNGTNANGVIGSSLINETAASGDGGNINITTRNLELKNGGAIRVQTFNSGMGGNINVLAQDSIRINEQSNINVNTSSNITATTTSTGDAGNINISSKLLSIINGGFIASLTRSSSASGDSGNVDINAESVDVFGIGLAGDASSISTSSFSFGDAGKITIDTTSLKVSDGALVSSSGFNNGSAGTVMINASDSVEIKGTSGSTSTQIRSSIRIFGSEIEDKNIAARTRRNLGLPDVPKGTAGDVIINTPKLSISNSAKVNVQNEGIGDGGTLRINADLLLLNQKGSITANTNSGVGGNIFIQSQDIQLRNNSSITATAQGNTGNGGNININTDTLIAFENSDIFANAKASFGGRVIINARGIFGTQFRPQFTSQSDITATSTQGNSFNGVVDINSFNFDPNVTVVNLPDTVTEATDKIATGCMISANNKFEIVGRGGLPENPKNVLQGEVIWSDLRPFSPDNQGANISEIRQSSHRDVSIIEATSWIKDAQGKVKLVARQPGIIPAWQHENCKGVGNTGQ